MEEDERRRAHLLKQRRDEVEHLRGPGRTPVSGMAAGVPNWSVWATYRHPDRRARVQQRDRPAAFPGRDGRP